MWTQYSYLHAREFVCLVVQKPSQPFLKLPAQLFVTQYANVPQSIRKKARSGLWQGLGGDALVCRPFFLAFGGLPNFNPFAAP